MRPVATLVLATLLVLGTAHATDQVYRWKDAQGVTHYSATPPPKGSYEAHDVRTRDPQQPAATAPAENPACATARDNIALLQGKQKVMIDSDHDGKPDKALGDEDRANQLALAQATLKTS
ncbi:MAG: DUF4124 domain-containing protein, partial [Lysobacteraceae bacterium]